MSLIAVAANKFSAGVEAPGTIKGRGKRPARKHTYDWREAEGSPANTYGVSEAFRAIDLRAALSDVYTTDAHMVAYVVLTDGVPLALQPRVNKSSLTWMAEQGFGVEVDTVFADVDNPGHVEWSEELREAFGRLWSAAAGPLATCGVYLTAHGYRLVQPLDEPIPVAEIERYIYGWHRELQAAGVTADPSCRDWTRVFRLPNVTRGGKPYSTPFADYSRMTARIIQPLDIPKKDAPGAGRESSSASQ